MTGASGFVGRHVVRALLARDANVFAVSRRHDPLVDTRATPVTLDIAAVESDVFARIGSPDVLIHLAWAGLPNYSSSRHTSIELRDQRHFLDTCIDAGVKQLVVAGTCLEYGLQSGELKETDTPKPVTEYGRAKNELHRHLSARRQSGNFGLTWMRLFYLYGAGQAKTSLYSQLKAAVDSGTASFDMSAGEQLRDFLDIETAASDIAGLALSAADSGTVNVCSGAPQTVAAVARQWVAAWRSDIRLNLGVYSYPDYEPFAFWGSVDYLNRLLRKT